MPIEIRSKDFSVTDAIREHVEQGLRVALERFVLDRFVLDRGVRRVVVRLGDLNCTKGEKAKFCRITAEVGFATVAVEEFHSNLDFAISDATRRFALKASRELAWAYHLTARARAADEVAA